MTKLVASVEVLSASLTGALSAEEIQAFTKDPKSVLLATVNADTSEFDVNVVENSASEVNLALPYYAFVDSSEAQAILDSDMDVAGGEIALTIAGVLGLIGAVTATTAATVAVFAGPPAGVAVGIAASVQAANGKNIDGSAK